MASALKSVSYNIDPSYWQQIRSYLLGENEETDPNVTTSDDSSKWEDVETENEVEDSLLLENSATQRSETRTWLDRIIVSTVPTFDVFAFASGKRIFVLELIGGDKWRILFRKELPDFDITSVVCLPIPPTRVTDPRPVEWTAIIMGLQDGRIVALNENGVELLSHRFQPKPVTEMKLQADQLFVTYPDQFVTISGFTLLATLKSNRARALRRRVASPQAIEQSEALGDSLVYEYWQLENVTQPTEIIAAASHRTTMWEKLVTASVKGGFNAKVSNRQPSYETFCALSSKDFLTFNWWTDETTPDILGGIASRIKTSVSVPMLSSWWSPSRSSDTTSATPPIRTIPRRSHLPDDGRIGQRIIPSYGDRLAAVCDDLGRVSLIDIQRRLLIRMWKGYRDAQCGWIHLPYGEYETGDRCDILCLIIFAPRRGILEVWSAQNGRRVAAFNVDRAGLLLYCPVNAMTRPCSSDSGHTVRFLDSRGHFFHIDISAAKVMESSETSTYWTASAKDQFRKRCANESKLDVATELLGRLSLAKDATYLVDQVVGSVDMDESKMQTGKLDQKSFIHFIDSVISFLEKEPLSTDSRAIYARCIAYRQITHFVAMIQKFADIDSHGDHGDPIENDQDTCTLLALRDVDELNCLLRELDENLQYRFMTIRTESIAPSSSCVLQRLFSVIDYRKLLYGSSSIGHGEQNIRLTFRQGVEANVLAELGDFIFQPFLTGRVSMEEFGRDVQPLLGLTARDWTKLFCAFWFNTRTYSVHPIHLYKLLNVLYESGNKELGGEFLTEIRHSLLECPRLPEALSLCIVVRALIRNRRRKSISDESDWCQIEKNTEDWDTLRTVLHALLLLDTCRHAICNGSRTVYADLEPISARRLLITGLSSLSEYLAEAFIAAGQRSVMNRLKDSDQRSGMNRFTAGDQVKQSERSRDQINRLERSRDQINRLERSRDQINRLEGSRDQAHRLERPDYHSDRVEGSRDQIDSLERSSGEADWIRHVHRARELLPLSLQDERLILSLLWGHVHAWFKRPSEIDHLWEARELVTQLDDAHLLNGFVTLAWRTFFCGHYEKLCELMTQSKGKDCTEEFERQTGLPGSCLLEFVKFVYELFNVMKAETEREEEEMDRKEELEDFLQDFFLSFRHQIPNERSKESVWELVRRQPDSVQHLVDLHWQMASAVLMAVSTDFSTRLEPFKLFQWDQRKDFFGTLSRYSFNHRLSDEDTEQQMLSNRRLLFVLSYVTEAIKRHTPVQGPKEEKSEENLLPDLSLAVKLAREWNLNFDAIRRQEVMQLYIAGFPGLAAKLVPLVVDKRQLAKTLLDMVGWTASRRVDTIDSRHSVSQRLRNWLAERKSSKKNKGSELDPSVCLAVLDCLMSMSMPDSDGYELCQELRTMFTSIL